MKFARPLVTLLVALSLTATAAGAQLTTEQRLRAHADSLARIRAERDSLERQMRAMQGTVREMGAEVTNLSRQTATTARLVSALDQQLRAISTEVEVSTASLVRAQDELALKEADMQRRLREIYKNGPLHTLEVLFSASSFSDLIARYKYLYLQTQRDRAMVRRVAELRDQIVSQREMRVRLEEEVTYTLAEKEQEERRFRNLEQQRRQALGRVQQQASQTEKRFNEVVDAEKKLSDIIAALDAERRRAGAPAGASVFRAGARMDWPVQGELVYRFGRLKQDNLTEINWNGIGISAPLGTTVKAVADGRVVAARSIDGYGMTVLIEHPGGDFSVYGSLSGITVEAGMTVQKGRNIGTVGVSDSKLGPHLHFEIRLGSAGGAPLAVDPLLYLLPSQR